MSTERVARWALISAACPPILLIGGWTLAAHLQPGGFDSATETISYLAGYAATDRQIMTLAIALAGIAHMVTALGLRPVGKLGRVTHAVGGLAMLGVAASPLPILGSSAAHGVWATLAFIALAVWPALGLRRRSPGLSRSLTAPIALIAAASLCGLLAWFFLEVALDGSLVGLSERVAVAAEAFWPFIVVLACLRSSKEHQAESVPS